MKTLRIDEKRNGELAIRGMSEKAQAFYNGSDPLTVAKLSDGTMSIRGEFGNYDALTEKECEELFENLYDEYIKDENWKDVNKNEILIFRRLQQRIKNCWS